MNNAANFTYGATIGAHAVAEAIQQPLLAAGIENTILNSVPMVAMGISALRIIYTTGDFILAVKEERPLDLAGFSATFLSSSSLTQFASSNRSHIMTIGSAAFGWVCFGFAIQALGDFVVAFRDFQRGKADYNKAFNNLIVSTLNLIGWGTIVAAHLSVFAAAASPLLIVGAACLVAGALYAGVAAVYKMSNERVALG